MKFFPSYKINLICVKRFLFFEEKNNFKKEEEKTQAPQKEKFKIKIPHKTIL